MGFLEAYKMAITSILSKKGRSFLTMLGVIIGVGAVIAAVAYAQGTTANITEQISEMGTNLVRISIVGRGSNRKVEYDQLKTFANDNSDIISAMAPSITTNSVTVKYGSSSMKTTTMLGTTPEYETINDRHVTSGRFILSNDVNNREKVAVIGTAVVKKLFSGVNPVGEKIKINGTLFKVVGVLTEEESGATSSDDDYIIVPVTVAQRVGKNTTIRDFSIKSATPEDVDAVMEKLEAFLLSILKSEDLYRVMDSQDMLDTLNEVTGTMMAMLGGIAAISLAVGGIGIMNIMLVSVTERTREIGIRKAIGAKKKNILVQFLIEAIMVTGFGGILGVLVGVLVIKFIFGGFGIVPEVYSVTWISISFGISLFVGIVFGMFPAVKASNLNPIEALRFE
ncbi:MAG: ABC transporter permease [Clostridiales bacterium GWC2_40_7]|nr:MAG: ABC transporter permease [Clostridiales bacterium GWC2_40_7]